MKTKNKDYIVLLLSSIIVLLVFSLPMLMKGGIHQGDDLVFHLNRIVSIVDSIKDKQFPLAIYPYSNYGFGYASPLFYCDLYLIIPSIIYYFGIFDSVVNVYKLTLTIYSFIGVLIVTYTSYKVSHNKIIAITSSIIWSFSSYHLTDAYYRSALGETIAMSFIPLVVYSSYKLFYLNDTSNREAILLALSFDSVLFAHNISFLIVVLMFGVICLINIKKTLSKEYLFTILKAILIAIGLGSFFLFPMVEQILDQKFIMSSSANWLWDGIDYHSVLSDFMFEGRFEIYFIGITLIVLSIYSFLFIKKKNTYINSLLIVSILFSLMTLSCFKISTIKLIGAIQYPFRFGIIPISVLPFLFSFTSNKYKYVICSLFIMMSLINFYPTISYLTSEERYLSSRVPNEEIFTTTDDRLWSSVLGNGEYLPLTYDINYKEHAGIIMYENLDPYIYEYDRNGTEIRFNTSFDYDCKILLPIAYYKGYKGYEAINNHKQELIVGNNEYYHLVEITVETGEHNYIIEYNGTMIQKASFIISLLTILLICNYKIKERKFVYSKEKKTSKNL